MGFLKNLARGLKKSAPMGAAIQRAQASAPMGAAIQRAIGRMKFKDGGAVTASRSVVSSGRGDGAAIRGKTKCKMY